MLTGRRRPAIWILALALGVLALAIASDDGRTGVVEAAGGESDEVFVPSEELPADSAVAFPVDI